MEQSINVAHDTKEEDDLFPIVCSNKIVSSDEDTESSHSVPKTSFKKRTPFKHKRMISVYRYIGDMKNVDMSVPENARRCLDMALGCVNNQKIKIKSLHAQNRSLNKYIHELECEIQEILSKEVINQTEGVLNVDSNDS